MLHYEAIWQNIKLHYKNKICPNESYSMSFKYCIIINYIHMYILILSFNTLKRHVLFIFISRAITFIAELYHMKLYSLQ